MEQIYNISDKSNERFKNVLKEAYLANNQLPKFIENDENFPDQYIEDSFVNLAVIRYEQNLTNEDEFQNNVLDNEEKFELNDEYNIIYENENTIPLNNLFNIVGQQKILIYGRAGVGKTTLTHKIKYDWAQGKLWNNKFDFVFCLYLKDLEVLINNDLELSDFIYHSFYKKNNLKTNITNLNVKELLKENKENILLVLDGYDEITNIEGKKRKLLDDFIFHCLQIPNVIMTSRHNAIGPALQKEFPTKLVNVGFNKHNINEYIDKFKFPDGDINKDYRKELKDFLERNNNALGICHIPINLYLLCCVSSELHLSVKGKDNDHITLSYLYNEVTHFLMKRYLIKNIKKNNDFKVYDSSYIEQTCKFEYKLIEKIAFEAMQRGKRIITSDIIRNYVQIDDLAKINQIGLLKALGNDNKMINDKDHYFVHLTFQEFMAARHIVRLLSSKDDNEVIEGIKFTEKYKFSRVYERVIIFIAGLTNILSSKEKNKEATYFWNIMLNGAPDLLLINQAKIIDKCLSETKNKDSNLNLDYIIPYINQIKDFKNSEFENKDAVTAECQVKNKLPYFSKAERNAIHFKVWDLYWFAYEYDRKIGDINDKSLNWENQELLGRIANILINNLNDKDEFKRLKIAKILSKLKIENHGVSEKIVNILINNLNDKDYIGKFSIIKSLSKLKIENKEFSEKIAYILINRLNNEDAYIISFIIKTLSNLKTQNINLLGKVLKILIANKKKEFLNEGKLSLIINGLNQASGQNTALTISKDLNIIIHSNIPEEIKLPINEEKKRELGLEKYIKEEYEEEKLFLAQKIFNATMFLNQQAKLPNKIFKNILSYDSNFYPSNRDIRLLKINIDKMDEANQNIYNETQISNNFIYNQHYYKIYRNSLIDKDYRQINTEKFAVSVIVGKNRQHSFLVAEGKNIVGNNVFYRFELVQNSADLSKAQIDITKFVNVSPENVETILQIILRNMKPDKQIFVEEERYNKEKGDTTKNKSRSAFDNNVDTGANQKKVKPYYSKTCIMYYEQFKKMYKEIKKDQQNPGDYNISGKIATETAINKFVHIIFGKLTNAFLPGHNCDSWVKEKLRNNLGKEEYDKLNLDNWTDIVVSVPSITIGKSSEALF